MNSKELLTISIIVFYVFVSCYFTIIVIKSPLASKKKRLNIFLVWLVPVLWGLLVKSMFKPLTKKDKNHDKSSFYESGIGENI